jgi:hypothetical protein
LQSRTCLFLQLCFFCNRSTSAVCNHTVNDVSNHLYFHQVATTSSKDKSSHIKLFTNFLQSQSHCYKSAITLWQDLQSTTFWFATVFFAIAAHQSLQTHSQGCCNHQYFDQVATHQAKTTLAAILQCRGTEFFLKLVFFLLVFFWNVFFCKITALRLQSHCYKGASNHPHSGFATVMCLQLLHISCCNM